MARTNWTHIAGSFLVLGAWSDAPKISQSRVTAEVQCFFEGTSLAAQIVSTRLLSTPVGLPRIYPGSAWFLPGGEFLVSGGRGELHRFGPGGAWEFRFDDAPSEEAFIPGSVLPWPGGCVARGLQRERTDGRLTFAIFSAAYGTYLGETSLGGYCALPFENDNLRWIVWDGAAWIEDLEGKEVVRISTRPDGATFRALFSPQVGADGALMVVDAPPLRATTCMVRTGPPREPCEPGVVIFEVSARGEALGQWRLPLEAEVPHDVISLPRDIAIVWRESEGPRLALLDRATGQIREVPLPAEVARGTPMGCRVRPSGGGLDWIGWYGGRPMYCYELALPGT